MAEHTDILTAIDGKLEFDPDRLFSIRDPEHVHPAYRETWPVQLEVGAFGALYDPTLSIDEKRSALAEVDFSIYWPPAEGGLVQMTEYEVPGCPEEPETPATLCVFVPKKLEGKKNRRAIFEISGGGMLYCEPAASGLDQVSLDYNCVVIGPKYRTSLEAPYPAAINDLHAAYAWTVENADMLGIDPDSIILKGTSSGGGLAAALPFRLMRYGFHPRGVCAITPITDDREVYPCSGTVGGFIDDAEGQAKGFDAFNYHTAYRMWLGFNYGSYRVGPEALANHATVEDCIGYPPCFIVTDEHDPDRDYNREFAGKLYAAHTHCEYHSFGGSSHGIALYNPDLSEIVKTVIDTAIDSFWKFDLRRPKVVDEYKAHVERKFANR